MMLLIVPALGLAQTVLYEDFEGCSLYTLPAGWADEDANADLDSFSVHRLPSIFESEGDSMAISIECGYSDDWFFTEGIDLTAGTKYRLRFLYSCESAEGKLTIYIGSGQSSGDTIEKIWEDTISVLSVFLPPPIETAAGIEVENDGTYYIGFRYKSMLGGLQALYVNYLSVEVEPDADVNVDTLELFSMPLVLGENETIKGCVSNWTSNPTGDFSVYLTVDDSVVDSSLVSLNGYEKDTITLNYIPSSWGDKTLSVIADLPGDTVHYNDTASLNAHVYKGPFAESFTDEDFPPPLWTRLDYAGVTSWKRGYFGWDEPYSGTAEMWAGGQPTNDWLITPKLSIWPGDTLSFWCSNRSPYSAETLLVKISTTSLGTLDFQILDTAIVDTSYPRWKKIVIPLDSYAYENAWIAFVYKSKRYDGYLELDGVDGGRLCAHDVWLKEVYPTSNLIIGSPTQFKAEISNNSPFTQYDVPVIIKIPSTTYACTTTTNISGYYTVEVTFPEPWVPPEVGPYEVVAYSANPGDEIPTNDTVQTCVYAFPEGTFYCEGFDSLFPPRGWRIEDVVGTCGEWVQTGDTGGHPDHDPVCGLQAYFNSWSCPSGCETRLKTGTVHIPSYKISMTMLEFWMYHDDEYSSHFDSLYIDISVDGGFTWSTLAGFQRYSENGGWELHKIYLTDYVGQDVRIGFRGHGDSGNDIFIDQIALVTEQYTPVFGDVIINEFMAKGSEWIELYNTQDYDIPLYGWILCDDDGTVDSLSGIIQAGGYHLHNNSTTWLGNNGDVIYLISPSGDTVDQVGFGNAGGAPVGAEVSGGFASTARAPDAANTGDDAQDFTMDFTPTPGAANDAPAPQLGSGLVINEVDAYVPNGDPDYIEIYNPSEDSVDLDGWIISDGDEIDTLSLGVKVPPEGVVGLYEGDPGSFSFDVNSYLGSSDVVYLFTPMGKLIRWGSGMGTRLSRLLIRGIPTVLDLTAVTIISLRVET